MSAPGPEQRPKQKWNRLHQSSQYLLFQNPNSEAALKEIEQKKRNNLYRSDGVPVTLEALCLGKDPLD